MKHSGIGDSGQLKGDIAKNEAHLSRITNSLVKSASLLSTLPEVDVLSWHILGLRKILSDMSDWGLTTPIAGGIYIAITLQIGREARN